MKKMSRWMARIAAGALAVSYSITALLSPSVFAANESVTTAASTSVQSEAYQWDSVNVGGGGFVDGIIATSDPNVFYARTDVGGAYRLDAATGKWTRLSDSLTQEYYGGLGVDSIAVDPTDADKVYIFCGQYSYDAGEKPSLLMRSDDGGKTFTYVEVSAQGFYADGNAGARNVGERLQVDPNNTNVLYCATRTNGVWMSTNRGDTWTQIREAADTGTIDGKSVGTCMVIVDADHKTANGNSTIYVADWKTDSQFAKYDGTSWTTLDSSAVSGLYPQRYATYDGKAYVTFSNSDFEGKANGTAETGCLAVLDLATGAITKSNAPTEYAMSGISISSDGQRMIVSTFNYGALYKNDPPTVSWGEDYGTIFLVSEDGGVSWSKLNGTSEDDTRIFLKDGGKTWVSDEKPHWAAAITFFPNDSTKAIVTSGNGTYLLTNLFESKKVYATFYADGIEETVPLDMVSPSSGTNQLVSVAYDAGGYCHTDITQAPTKRVGVTVTQSGVDNETGCAVDRTGVAVCESNPDLIAVCGTTTDTKGSTMEPLQVTFDGGDTWAQVDGSSTYGANGTCAISSDGSILYWMPYTSSRYATNEGSTLYCYPITDNVVGTPTSVSVAGGSSIKQPHLMADTVNSANVYISSVAGLYYSTNAGKTFAKINSSDTARLNQMSVVPGVEGVVYEANGQYSDASLSFYNVADGSNTVVSGVSKCEAVGFGVGATAASKPAMYIWGVVSGETGLFRSDDMGESWVRINDGSSMFAGPGNSKLLVGDRCKYGRVYMATYGQGIIYGEPAGSGDSGNGDSNGSDDSGSSGSGDSENGNSNGNDDSGSSGSGDSGNGNSSGSSGGETNGNGNSSGSSDGETNGNGNSSGSSGGETNGNGNSNGSSGGETNGNGNSSGSSDGETNGNGNSSGSSGSETNGNGNSSGSSDSETSGNGSNGSGNSGTSGNSSNGSGNSGISGSGNSNGSGNNSSSGTATSDKSTSKTTSKSTSKTADKADVSICKAPSNLKATSPKRGKVKLTWKKVSGAKKYKIYYATKKSGKYKRLLTTSKTSITTSRKMRRRKRFYFKVYAVNSEGKSGKASSIKTVRIK